MSPDYVRDVTLTPIREYFWLGFVFFFCFLLVDDDHIGLEISIKDGRTAVSIGELIHGGELPSSHTSPYLLHQRK